MARRQTGGVLSVLSMLLAGVAAYAATPGTFQLVGDTTTPRVRATATLLNDGTVLLVGGWKRGGPSGNDLVSQATAERFDPQTNSFTAVGSLAIPRSSHAAVRLQDGRVLIVGGSNDIEAQNFYPDVLLAPAEIYDPATGKFTPTGELITPRVTATATLLPNGKVLITGGLRKTLPFVLDAAELFDPATGKFTSAGSTTIPRNNHVAVALPDGRVVIMGGLPGLIADDARLDGQPLRSVEIYDPATGTFSPAGQMAEPRAFFQATLLPDGRILAIGGATTFDNTLNAVDQVTNSVEIYDPATGQSTLTGQMVQSRINPNAAALADGRVLVIGGQKSRTDNTTEAADLIDPITGKVSATGPMSTFRNQGVAVLLPDGRVLVAGGKPRVPSAEVYIP